MKQGTKLSLLVAAILIAVGIITMTIAGLFDARFSNIQNPFVHYESHSGTTETENDDALIPSDGSTVVLAEGELLYNLFITIEDVDIVVVPSETDEITAQLTGGPAIYYYLTDNELNIYNNNDSHPSNAALTLSIPAYITENGMRCQTITESGNVSIENLTFGNLDLQTKSGEGKLYNVIAEELIWSASSGDLDISTSCFGSLQLHANSGSIRMTDCREDYELHFCDITTESGSISIDEIRLFDGNISIQSTSGDISLAAAGDYDSIYLTSTSGDIELSGDYNTANIDTASGEVECSISNQTTELQINTSSGKVELQIPQEKEGFSLYYYTGSGKLKSEIPLANASYDESTYTNGVYDSCYITVNTASGDLSLKTND